MDNTAPPAPDFFTDQELCRRWRCGPSYLWRMRHGGMLKPPLKIGVGDVKRVKNLTPAAEVYAVEKRCES